MTIAELITKLQSFDPTLLVFQEGYEGGIEDVDEIRPVAMRLNENSGMDVFGPHGELFSDEIDPEAAHGILFVRRS